MWGKKQELVFKEAKQRLTSTRVLTHYNPEKTLVLSCDASPYGLGVIISHRLDDGSEKPIAFASKSLAPAERKSTQMDKDTYDVAVEYPSQELLTLSFI